MYKEERKLNPKRILLTKPSGNYKQYIHLMITETSSDLHILNIVKGRLTLRKKTTNAVYQQYPMEAALYQLEQLSLEYQAKGYIEEPESILDAIMIPEDRVLDKAKWHYEGDFPEDLTKDAAYTATGMFITWLINNNWFSEEIEHQFATEIEKVKQKQLTGAEFYRKCLDGVFSTQELADEIKPFVNEYLNIQKDIYTAEDYVHTFQGVGLTFYHVANTWENYDLIEPVIEQRFKVFWERIQKI
jgi:predicted Rdx family selenoprotein